jgi:hypothetical protein
MKVALLLMMILSPAFGEEAITVPDGYIMPRIPSEAEKRAALWLAYELNNQSMERVGSIDLTATTPPKPVATVTITPDAPATAAAPVKKSRK